jgi:hypothetical protein
MLKEKLIDRQSKYRAELSMQKEELLLELSMLKVEWSSWLS